MWTCYRLAVSDSMFCRQCVQVCVAVFAASEFPATAYRERKREEPLGTHAKLKKYGCVTLMETRDDLASLALLAS